MNDELRYAEMLEIPVETVTMSRKERKKKSKDELSDRLVKEVNEKMETSDPAYTESTPIEREYETKPRSSAARRVLIGELVAVVALCAGIFLTNIFLPESAINTFVRGLFRGSSSEADTRVYGDFALSPVVNEYENVEITVSETGVMSFTADCSVYAPCAGTLEKLSGDSENGYSVVLRHSDSFTTVMSGLDAVYFGEGDAVYRNTPLAHTDGERTVRVMFYDGETLITNYSVGEGTIAWS